jgi:hypothetical protein
MKSPVIWDKYKEIINNAEGNQVHKWNFYVANAPTKSLKSSYSCFNITSPVRASLPSRPFSTLNKGSGINYTCYYLDLGWDIRTICILWTSKDIICSDCYWVSVKNNASNERRNHYKMYTLALTGLCRLCKKGVQFVW